MRTRYVAHGLVLHSSFRLPGMNPDSREGLPALTLELTTVDELESTWSGASGPPAWQGLLGDGRELTIERGMAGEIVFTYADQARFRLDARGQRLECAPRRAALDWQRALLGKVIPSISVMRGYEALHAGVVDSPDGVVAIAGPSGSGKSTLAVELMYRGWPLFADDELTLGRGADAVRAHHGTPHMTVALDVPQSGSCKLGTLLGVLAGERWLSASNTTNRTRPVRMICLLERRDGLTLGASMLPANPLLLAPYMLGLSTSVKRQRSRFCLYSDLVEVAKLVRLTGDSQSTPGQLADVVERAVADESYESTL
jgi:hypothetical protein